MLKRRFGRGELPKLGIVFENYTNSFNKGNFTIITSGVYIALHLDTVIAKFETFDEDLW